jgi:PAS domain S-box-containing protein
MSDQHRPTIIYLVDDDPLVTSSLEAFLGLTFGEYTIKPFNNPLEALKTLEQDQPQLIISDFLMPEMDGIQFLGNARAVLPESTLILLTGYADKENAIAAVNDAHIFKYIEKPWSNDQLKQSVEQGIERANLLIELRNTISELEDAKSALSHYSQQLEGIVAERTKDVQQALSHLEAIVRGSGDGIATINSQGELITANPTLLNWLGKKPSNKSENNITGQPLADYLSLKEPLTKWLHSLGSDGVGLGETALINSANGAVRPVEISASLLNGNDDEQGQWVLIIRDLTKRKAEERLREDFVATLTHDLRVPLLAAIQTLGMLSNGDLGQLTPQQQEVTSMLVTNNEDMLSLVNTLLDIYKYESGRKTLVMQPVNLFNLAEHVTKQLTELATSRQHTLTLTPAHQPDEQLTINGDKQELQRVLTNLIGNAIHHTPVGGTITVTVTPSNEHLTFAVSDTGRGIPKNDLDTLFKRFAQGRQNVRSSGSGLGLYLCKQIIGQHGGVINVTSTTQADIDAGIVSGQADQPTTGSTFAISLPYETTV